MKVQVYKTTQEVDKDTVLDVTKINAGIFTLTDTIVNNATADTTNYTKVANVNKPYTVDGAGAPNSDWVYLGDADVTGSIYHQYWFDPVEHVIVDLTVDDMVEGVLKYRNYVKGSCIYPATGVGSHANSMTFGASGKLPAITGDFGATYDIVYLNLPGIKSRNTSKYAAVGAANIRVDVEITPFLKIKVADLGIASETIPLYTIMIDGNGRCAVSDIGTGITGVTDIYIPVI